METNQNKSDNTEINLGELFGVLWNKVIYIVVAAVAAGLIAFIVSTVFMTPQYESTTKMYVLNKQDSGQVTSGDLQASTLMIKDYSELIKSRTVTETVISNLGLNLKHEGLLGKMTVTIPTDTRVISITVRDANPNIAAQIADEIRDVAAQHIQSVMNIEAVNVVDYANIPTSPVSPSVKKNLALGILVGAFLAIAVIIIMYLVNDTIKTDEDVQRFLKTSVLGVIPLASNEKSHSSKRRNSLAKK